MTTKLVGNRWPGIRNRPYEFGDRGYKDIITRCNHCTDWTFTGSKDEGHKKYMFHFYMKHRREYFVWQKGEKITANRHIRSIPKNKIRRAPGRSDD